ncbi:hypothetical protein L2725_07250 [Shewanella corallii]|uniref:Uncharacterized protein n=1 Tax=Shewanella corallii TaxID=560080 RepID=A0ABT0N548_9GAMM|nr:hypothetical protein [Shewanella corallii]MCL2913584.1 hypothetical protein [Shewanella corallii]
MARPKFRKPNPLLHFTLTMLTFGLWGIVWCYLLQRAEGKSFSLFDNFDHDYWSYLIEREQPPASLYSMQYGKRKASSDTFDA